MFKLLFGKINEKHGNNQTDFKAQFAEYFIEGISSDGQQM